ncbi:flavin reductase family protein [Ruegeria sp.]|uniref:flavin reductase family protein n=1 Tax=Ruegeria sp. TaxID=1879320 RepID=UPI0023125647|nr:flavin reductase family protein [Ruegeria sp.]MDA7967222.1 flavin reductase family protein [Ruegeria sp.]
MDQRDYRRALGSFPTGVTIVTAFDPDREPWGLTANSFTSVSLQPPVISVCIAKAGRVFPTLSGSDHFAVNILSAAQRDLALHFASDVENRFTDTDWTAGSAAPLLPGASAHLECTVHDRVDAGDHEILLGRVLDYTHRPDPPLVFCRGSFFAAPQPEASP